MLAEDNQLGARNGLGGVQLFEKDIGRRTAGAALGSEELDQDGIGGRGFIRIYGVASLRAMRERRVRK
jgi:hypothetical protein